LATNAADDVGFNCMIESSLEDVETFIQDQHSDAESGEKTLDPEKVIASVSTISFFGHRVRGDIEWPKRLTFEGGEMCLKDPRMTEAIYRPVTHDTCNGKVCLIMLRRSGHGTWWRLLHDSYKGPVVSVDRWPDDAHKFRWTRSHPLSIAEWNNAIFCSTLVVSSEGVDLDADPKDS